MRYLIKFLNDIFAEIVSNKLHKLILKNIKWTILEVIN